MGLRFVYVVCLFLGAVLLGWNLHAFVSLPKEPGPATMNVKVTYDEPEEPAPVVTASGDRLLVEDVETRALRVENEVLRHRVQQLEAVRPTTRGELAVVLGVKESDLTRFLDSSEMLPDAKTLADATQVAGAKNVWEAIQAEQRLYRNMATFKAKNPCEPENRAVWHSTTWVPFYSAAITSVCDELYRLNLPSTVVESFRNKLNEGI